VTSPVQPLTVEDHRRDSAAMTYVYPVVSRRAGGVSVGINLNPNNACNWRCIYCQVPDLQRGGPPPIDLAQLEDELRRMLDDICSGGFMRERVPEDLRVFSDVAFSGNGEPTSAAEFSQAVEIVVRVLDDFGLGERVKLRLITNGSLLDRAAVRDGIAAIGQAGGEVWFKLDAGSAAAMERINGTRQTPETVSRRLVTCADLCETWVQSCFFAFDGVPPSEDDVADYLALLKECKASIAGVHLYGLARSSCQAEAERLERLPAAWLEALAEHMRDYGLTVKVSP
jgi:wyosine [tRNA(Phe)-imidazoG37] synthetase (radical SAM superfamily)